MTVYATAAEMESALGLQTLTLIADDARSGSYDAVGVVTPALASASSFADGYLSAYLPITTIPDVLRDAVIMIAAQNIRLPRDKGTGDSEKAYKNAVDWLKKIAGGDAVLPGYSADTLDPGEPELYANDRAWTRTLSRGVF